MNIIYTHHAHETCILREISKQEVKHAIANGRRVLRPNNTVVVTCIETNIRVIMVEKGEGVFVVITAYHIDPAATAHQIARRIAR